MAAVLEGRNKENVSMKISFIFQWSEIVLFLPSNMAAMQTLYFFYFLFLPDTLIVAMICHIVQNYCYLLLLIISYLLLVITLIINVKLE